MYTNPLNEENVILCAGDESSNGVIFWDYNASENTFTTAKTSQQPVLDIELIYDAQYDRSPIISCLSETTVKLYKLSG